MRKIVFLLISIALLACNSSEKKKQTKGLERKVEKVVEHYENGIKKLEGETVNCKRHGPWKYYYANGFLWSEGSFWYGERKGYSIIYYKSGKKQMEGQYAKDLKIGKWKLWNEDGSLNQIIDLDKMLTGEDSVKLELKPGKK